MRFLLLALIFLLAPSFTWSHPGKTDSVGGHKCYKDCDKWELLYGEYHLHDKDGKAIRVAKKGSTRKPAGAAKTPRSARKHVVRQSPDGAAAPESLPLMPSEEVSLAVSPLLLVLLVLLLLLLHRRSKSKQ